MRGTRTLAERVQAVREVVRDHGGRCAHTDAVARGGESASVVLAGIIACEEGPQRAGELMDVLRARTRLPGLFEAACISLLTRHATVCEEAR